jgi:hypothetical protein
LEAHREHVAADRAQDAELAEPSRDPRQRGEQQDRAGDDGDVLPGDGQEVIEARLLETLLELA